MNYKKDLTEDLRLRLSKGDMDFLRALSQERCTTISEVIRSILGEYRRAIDNMKLWREAIDTAQKAMLEGKKGEAVHGDTKTDFDH